MSRHFLLNLVNRSANKTTSPQARPYLCPVFMPPSPMVPPVGTQPSPLMSQGRIQTMQVSQKLPSRVVPNQPLSIASNPFDSEQPITSAPSSSPVPPPRPASLVKTKPPVLIPVELSPDSGVNSPHAIQQPDSITGTPGIQAGRSGEMTPSPEPSPPNHHEPALQKNDNVPVQTLFQPSVTAIQNEPSSVRPGIPLPFVQKNPNVLLTPSAIEDITIAEPYPLPEPKLSKISVPQSQISPLEASSAKVIMETIREIQVPVYSDISPAPGTSIPREKHPVRLTALPQKTPMEPSTAAKTSSHPPQPEAPGPNRFQQVDSVSRQQLHLEQKSPGPFRVKHVTPVPEQQTHLKGKSAGPFRFEHVIPAPEQQPPFRAQQARSHSTEPIQVSIGTIDLHVNSPEPVGYQTPNRRKPPQGFDAFRHRRLYSGWEV